jgi:hypothetical protein
MESTLPISWDSVALVEIIVSTADVKTLGVGYHRLVTCMKDETSSCLGVAQMTAILN